MDAGARVNLLGTARGGALNFAGALANALLQFVLVIVVTRGLGPRGTGIFFGAAALFTILSIASQLGADTGLVRAIPPLISHGRHAELRGVVRVAIVPTVLVGVVVAAGTYVFAPQLASLFMPDVPTTEATRLIKVLAPFLPLATTTLVLLSVTRGLGTMMPTVVVENVGKPSLRLLLVGSVLTLGAGAFGVTVAWALPIAVGVIVAAICVMMMMKRRAAATPAIAAEDAISAVAFWRSSLARGLAGVFEITLGWLDILLIGAFRSPEEVGVYAAVSRTAVVALFALRAAALAIAPRLSALISQESRADAQLLYQVTTWWLISLTWPVYITLAVFSQFLLGVFGVGFTVGADALTILSLAMLVNIATGNVHIVLLMAGKSSWNLANASIALALNIGLNLLLIPAFGIEGAAVAWATSIVVHNFVALIEVKFLLGLAPFGRGYGLAVAATSLCFGVPAIVISVLFGQDVATFLAYTLISIAVYVVVIYRARDTLHLEILREAVTTRAKDGRP